MPQIAHDLDSLRISPLPGKPRQSAVWLVVRQLAFDQVRQGGAFSGGVRSVAQAKIHFSAVLGAYVVQAHLFAFGILLPMNVFEQMAGNQVFKARAPNTSA